jgi:transposase InsO family protein
MSRRERDVLKVMSLVLEGKRTQIEAGRLLGRSVRQVRRIQRRLEAKGDVAVVHRLRGKPSNAKLDPSVRKKALAMYRQELAGFDPKHAWEKLTEAGLKLSARTVQLWLVAEGLWKRVRQVEQHRRRRQRQACLGEMVQADASEHDWLEGCGPRMELVGMIDDATGRIFVRFYESETTLAYMDLLSRYIQKFGRPLIWYSDRAGIFRAEEKVAGYDEKQSVPTQFSRALCELDMQMILAGSPQAKGRVERLWGTLQKRWVSEFRRAKITTMEAANELIDGKLMADHNRRFAVKPASANDAHRSKKGFDLPSILSCQAKRRIRNDYTIQFDNHLYQLHPPVLPGQRGGDAIIERRLDGSTHIRFKTDYLPFTKIKTIPIGQSHVEPAAMTTAEADALVNTLAKTLGALPPDPRSLSLLSIPAGKKKDQADACFAASARPAVHRPTGRSGRTPALPYPPGGKAVVPSRISKFQHLPVPGAGS